MKAPRPLAFAPLAAALLLAAPVTVLAQAKPRPAAKPVGASAPTAVKPSLTVAPAPAPAPAPEPAPAPFDEEGPWRTGLVVGYEKNADAELAGPRVQLELERDLVPLGGRGRLSFVGAAGWFRGTRSDSLSLLGAAVKVDTTADLFELIPSFRASFALAPRLRLFAEVGVGGAWTTTTVESSTSAVPGAVDTTKSDAWAGVLRASLGGSWQLNDRVRLGVELPTIHRRYGEAVAQTLSFSAMAAYAF